jgi:hypothetical protein
LKQHPQNRWSIPQELDYILKMRARNNKDYGLFFHNFLLVNSPIFFANKLIFMNTHWSVHICGWFISDDIRTPFNAPITLDSKSSLLSEVVKFLLKEKESFGETELDFEKVGE